jgi:hypothetical protein
MTKSRRKIDPALKAKIALEALREQDTVTPWPSVIRFTPIRFTHRRGSCSIRRRGPSRAATALFSTMEREREIERLHSLTLGYMEGSDTYPAWSATTHAQRKN